MFEIICNHVARWLRITRKRQFDQFEFALKNIGKRDHQPIERWPHGTIVNSRANTTVTTIQPSNNQYRTVTLVTNDLIEAIDQCVSRDHIGTTVGAYYTTKDGDINDIVANITYNEGRIKVSHVTEKSRFRVRDYIEFELSDDMIDFIKS